MADVEIFYTPAELAEMLRISKMTVWRRLKEGKWKGFRVGTKWRISEEEVNRIKEGFYNDKEPKAHQNNFKNKTKRVF